MISLHEPIICLKNYAGEFHFQTEGDYGTYYLVTYPETKEFLLTFPDFRSERGNLQELKNLFSLLECYEENLTHWVYKALNWYEYPAAREQQTWVRKKVEIGNYTYQMEYNSDTDEFILTLPAKTIIAFRQALMNDHPEIISLQYGELSALITNILYDATNGGDIIDRKCDPIKLPLSFSPRVYKIHDLEYAIDYTQESDIFFLQLPMSIKKGHRTLIDIIPEIGLIGDGALKKVLLKFMEEHSNHERVRTYTP